MKGFDKGMGKEEQKVEKEIREGVAEILDKVIPAEDLHSAEELVVEEDEALKEVKAKQRRRFIDEETQLPRVGGNFGVALKNVVKADRSREDFFKKNPSAFMEKDGRTVFNEERGVVWDRLSNEREQQIDSISKMIADALREKGGSRFPSGAPYRIGHIGGVEMLLEGRGLSSGAGEKITYENFVKTIGQFLPEDCKYLASEITTSAYDRLFTAKGESKEEAGKERRVPKKRIAVIGADLTAITGNGNPHNTDWVIVFDTDPLYEQLRKTTNGAEVKSVDKADLKMAEKGYTQYTYADTEYETEKEASK